MTPKTHSLPARPHLDHLKKLAKKRLAALRATHPQTKLAAAQLAVARDHGFPSWRALKAHVDQLRKTLPPTTKTPPTSASPHLLDAFFKATFADFRNGTLHDAEELLHQHPTLATDNIYTACITAHEPHLTQLLRINPTLATTPGGPRNWPPLLYLCYSRYLRLKPRSANRFARCAQLLLDHGADPNSFFMHENWRETALYGAAGIANSAPLTKTLLDAGADPNQPDLETLYHVAEFTDHQCLQLILQKIRPGDWLNYCMGHKLDMEDPVGLQLFLDHGADPNHLNKQKSALEGLRPLHFAILRHRAPKTLQTLLHAGANPNLPDAHGTTPLALAKRLGHTPAIRLLRAAHAADSTNPRAEILAAIMSGNEKLTRRLLPDPRAFIPTLSEDEQKLLPHAAESGNLKAVKLLLTLGWNLETPGNWNGTALHQAIFHGHLPLVKFLLLHRARITHKNAFGGTAIGTALHAALHEPRPSSLAILQLLASRIPPQKLQRYITCARKEGAEKIAQLLEKTIPAHNPSN